MQKISFNRLYPLWLWLVTVVCTPILYFFWIDFTSKPDDNGGIASFYPLFIVFGLFFSLPAFFIVFLVYQSLRTALESPLLLKLLTIFMAIVGMIITLNVIGGSMMSSLTRMYAVGIAVAGLLLKAKQVAPKEETTDERLLHKND